MTFLYFLASNVTWMLLLAMAGELLILTGVVIALLRLQRQTRALGRVCHALIKDAVALESKLNALAKGDVR